MIPSISHSEMPIFGCVNSVHNIASPVSNKTDSDLEVPTPLTFPTLCMTNCGLHLSDLNVEMLYDD